MMEQVEGSPFFTEEPQDSAIGSIVERMFLGDMFTLFRKPERMSTFDYGKKYRFMTSEVSALTGAFDPMVTPYMLRPMVAFDHPDEKIVVAQKSAQIAWSETQNTYLARRIQLDPQNIIMAFPREATGKAYSLEKIRPLIKTTPELLKLIGDPDKCSFSFYKFRGGFLKLVTAGSPTAMKSSSAPVVIIEEPDDLKEDIKGQGDALKIIAERQKTFEERLLIYGGTPTDKGFSKVAQAYQNSNRMKYWVPCHSCGDDHILDFNNLHYEKYTDQRVDPEFGKFDPYSSHYLCPHCKTEWSNEQKNLNVRAAVDFHDLGWVAERDHPTVGFAFNELLSPFAGSHFVDLTKKKLEAMVDLDQGKEGKMKSYVNNCEGLAYEPKLNNLNAELLERNRRSYEELTVPVGGIILTMGVDVQHNRLAIIIKAWGRDGNSWTVYWGEIFGYVKDRTDPVWAALTAIAINGVPYVAKAGEQEVRLPITSVSIDSGDGGTTELVYSWVLEMNKINSYVFACKGASEIGQNEKEIFTVPADPDGQTDKSQRKKVSETMGVNVYIVGTQKGKDEVLRKLGLNGIVDRSYFYDRIRNDYSVQLLSNVRKGGVGKYELKLGQNDEALDCEVLALHASRAIHLNVWTETHWAQAEASIFNAVTAKKVESAKNVTKGIN